MKYDKYGNRQCAGKSATLPTRVIPIKGFNEQFFHTELIVLSLIPTCQVRGLKSLRVSKSLSDR